MLASARLPAIVLASLLASTALSGAAKAPDAPIATGPAAVRTIDARAWPREFTVDGTTFSINRPQIDAWTGNKLEARTVMAVKTGETKDAQGKAVATADYGVLWLTARTETDKAAREVVLTDLKVDRIAFPTAKAKEAQYLALVRKIAPAAQQVASLDQIEAALAITKARITGLNSHPVENTPPEVIFAFKPSVLVLIDGQPVLRPTDTAGVERVINTRAVMLKSGGTYWLGHNGQWASAAAVDGPWRAGKPPAPVAGVAAKLAAARPGDKPQQAPASPKSLPDIVVRTHPSELIVVDGEPKFQPIAGTALKFVSNTPADVLLDNAGTWYVLLAGRWFAGPSSKGPWHWVDPKTLPADFVKIPGESPKSAVLASIPGTPEAQESLVANAVPQTATVNRKEAKFQARYDGGSPQFKRIYGTDNLAAAANSATPVISAGGAYYALDNGVWFTAASPNGPWVAATSVPAEIYTIPTSSPLHYVTYVYIYGADGDEIHVGYTPGYYGTIVSDGVVVYGSGYACESWTGEEWYGCPTPYGYGAVFGYGEAVGWSMAFGWGYYDPWYWYDPWWGPWGYWPGYWYPVGGAIAGNFYGRWGNAVVGGTAAAWANPWTGNYGGAARGGYYNERTGGRGYGAAGRNYNVYTGNLTSAAGGVRYNPQTGRVVAGAGGSVYNVYTGEGVAGGKRTTINTDTGRVTQSGGVAGRGQEGAGAAGGFRTSGERGDAAGAGYIHYDRDSGDISKGGVVDVNGNVYAGKDGNVYKKTDDGWQEVNRPDPKTRRSDADLDAQRAARDRGYERDRASRSGFERQATTRPSFDRGAYGGGYSGHMGGFRGGGGGFRGGGGGFRR